MLKVVSSILGLYGKSLKARPIELSFKEEDNFQEQLGVCRWEGKYTTTRTGVINPRFLLYPTQVFFISRETLEEGSLTPSPSNTRHTLWRNFEKSSIEGPGAPLSDPHKICVHSAEPSRDYLFTREPHHTAFHHNRPLFRYSISLFKSIFPIHFLDMDSKWDIE